MLPKRARAVAQPCWNERADLGHHQLEMAMLVAFTVHVG